MIHLGGQASTPEAGYARADAALADGTALRIFLAMIEAQGGDASVFKTPKIFHRPGATEVVKAWERVLWRRWIRRLWAGGATDRGGPGKCGRAGGSTRRHRLPCAARSLG